MARTRTFIGVEIGDEIRKRAVALQQELAKTGAGVKWAAEGMHVTLLFLGDVDDRDMLAVCRAVKEVAAAEPGVPAARVRRGGVPDGAPAEGRSGPASPTGPNRSARLYGSLETKMLDLGCLPQGGARVHAAPDTRPGEGRGRRVRAGRRNCRSCSRGTAGRTTVTRCGCTAASWAATGRSTRCWPAATSTAARRPRLAAAGGGWNNPFTGARSSTGQSSGLLSRRL